ncbi:spermatid nuclear transition protein 3 [Nycticebus coucang]|uniref:spermatid nuclear transition protein 3 n=1 Tax=Nycticebus coucang TaxID=9470 RepID=UPI00234D9392|nr:spermatid nuclear transition protein 3 [Nycticebus coucang]
MTKVTRKPEESSRVVKQLFPNKKRLTLGTKGRKKRRNPYQPKPRSGGKVKKMQRGIKRLLHGSSRKKSSTTSTAIPRKVKRVKKSKKFRPLAKM